MTWTSIRTSLPQTRTLCSHRGTNGRELSSWGFQLIAFLSRLTGLWKYLASEKEKPLVAGCLTIPQIWEKVTVSSFQQFDCPQIEDVVVKSVLCGLSSFRGDGQNMQQQFDDSKPMGPNFNAQLDKVKVKLKLPFKPCNCWAGQIQLQLLPSLWLRHPSRLTPSTSPDRDQRSSSLLCGKTWRFCQPADGDPAPSISYHLLYVFPQISEMFRIVGYHVPLSAISNPKRLATACKKLNISPNTCESSQHQP